MKEKLICNVKGHIINTSCDGYFIPSCVFCGKYLPLEAGKELWFDGIDIYHRSEKKYLTGITDACQKILKDPAKYIHHEDHDLVRLRNPNVIRALYMECCYATMWLKLTGEALFQGMMMKGKKRLIVHRMETVLYLLRKGWTQECSPELEGTGLHSILTNVGQS